MKIDFNARRQAISKVLAKKPFINGVSKPLKKKEKYESVLQELDVAFVFAIKISFYCIHCVMGMHRKTALLTVHLVLGRLYSFSLLSIFVYDTNLLILIYY